MHDAREPSHRIPKAAANAFRLKVPKPVSARCLILAVISALNGCAFLEPFEAPEIVAGSETTVTLRTGSLRDANSYAQRYCARYGKHAILTSRGKMSERAVTFHLYECMPVEAR